MSYEDKVGMFWERVRKEKLNTTQIALGLALLEMWRETGFPSRYSVPNEVLCDLLSLNIKTLRAARKRLTDGGIFIFEDGNARRQPIYSVGMDVDGDGEEVREEKPKPAPAPPPPVPRERPKRARRVEESLSLFPEEKKAKKVRKEPEPPSYAVVLMECRKKGMTDEEAKVFYDYYNAQGWVTSSGQRIRSVDSMVNRWLTNEKKRKDESDRRFIQQRGPSSAENIREAQGYLIREMQQYIHPEADGCGEAIPGAVPYHE